MFFDQKIARFKMSVKDSEEVIKLLSNELYQRGIVNEDFKENVLKREEEFPTGLSAGKFGIAIPHTDSQYVEKSQIAFLSLQKPVNFRSMVNQEEQIPVSLVFLIAMSRPHEQAEALTKLMSLFGNEALMLRLCECKSMDEYQDILKDNDLA